MKKALILAYDFPPYVSVGGLRPHCWYKYFHEFDVYPIIVTRQWDNKYGNHLDYISASESAETIIEKTDKGTIIRTPYRPNLSNRIMLKYGDSKFKLIRKFLSAYYEFTQFLFFTGPKKNLYAASNDFLKNEKTDIIIATGSPFVLFKYASKLGKKYNIPWIADYRDPWSQNDYERKNFLQNFWNKKFETIYTRSATAIITVNSYFEAIITSLVKNKKTFIIPNGFDPESFKHCETINQNHEVLQIAYVGHIYDWHPIHSFLKTISLFIEKNPSAKILVNFYGVNVAERIQQIVAKEFSNIRDHVKIYPKISNAELMQRLAKENLMLLFNYYSFSGTKIYDYIALKRAVLFCYSNDPDANKLKKDFYLYKELNASKETPQEKIIKETSSGYIIENANHLLSTLTTLYEEFSATGEIKCNTKNEDMYSRKHQVKQLAEIIKNI